MKEEEKNCFLVIFSCVFTLAFPQGKAKVFIPPQPFIQWVIESVTSNGTNGNNVITKEGKVGKVGKVKKVGKVE